MPPDHHQHAPHPLQMVTHTIILYGLYLCHQVTSHWNITAHPQMVTHQVTSHQRMTPHPQLMVTHSIVAYIHLMFNVVFFYLFHHISCPVVPFLLGPLQQMVTCLMQTISLTFLFSEILAELQTLLQQLNSMYLLAM